MDDFLPIKSKPRFKRLFRMFTNNVRMLQRSNTRLYWWDWELYRWNYCVLYHSNSILNQKMNWCGFLFFSCFSSLLSLFTRTTGERNLGKDGRHQEEDASHEAWEGQRHGQGRRLRTTGQGRQPQSWKGKNEKRKEFQMIFIYLE